MMKDTANNGIRPALSELVALRAIAQRRPPARRGRYGQVGAAPSPHRGRGMEYAESREYVAGDDVRHIDWRVTARSGRTHTKLYHAERDRLTLLLADTTPSLYFGTRERFKSVQAARAGAVAAWAAVRDGDRIAALRGCRSEAPIPPAAGARGALRVLDALVRWYSQPPVRDDGLAVAVEHAQRLLRPGSRLVVLADPHSIATVPAARWSGLAAHAEVIALLLTDPLELAPPASVLPFLSDGERVRLDLAGGAQRREWDQEFVHGLETAIGALSRCGVRAMALPTDAASESWLPLLARAQPQVA
ncbi:DUF58 domain-containing protein [Pseudoxanthomonas kalamensis DSM 18571]|uniref:DUF58 domain-containing protein n=1 Tax=Pseudoxanthomonas kalamensis TaxID=289483 RepID=UPI0013918B7E|nr:DUF58 domain-containing protein [Pseudoxanthomonas kalamensis]KAF1711392.1 DUF58 domain-containing protein [Pseudoxanthomonas kalamensis DSM 18571]